jgi:hypothetical protein
VIFIKTEKRQHGKEGAQVSIPILAPLAASLAAAKTGNMTFLLTESGQPWNKNSFGHWFRKACRAANCPGSAHRLRKAGATRAAERSATERQHGHFWMGGREDGRPVHPCGGSRDPSANCRRITAAAGTRRERRAPAPCRRAAGSANIKAKSAT